MSPWLQRKCVRQQCLKIRHLESKGQLYRKRSDAVVAAKLHSVRVVFWAARQFPGPGAPTKTPPSQNAFALQPQRPSFFGEFVPLSLRCRRFGHCRRTHFRFSKRYSLAACRPDVSGTARASGAHGSAHHARHRASRRGMHVRGRDATPECNSGVATRPRNACPGSRRDPGI